MVVGQHRCGLRQSRSASSSSATRRSSGVVTFMFSRGAAHEAHAPAAGLDERSRRRWRRRGARRRSRARARAPARGRPAASGPPTARERSSVAHDRRAAGLLDRVGHRRGGDRGVAAVRLRAPRGSRATSSGRHAAGARRRGRARRRRRRPRAARRGRTATAPRRPGTPIVPRRARRRPGGSATTMRSISATARERVDAPLRASDGPRASTNALGPPDPRRSPRPAATSNATAIRMSPSAAASLRARRARPGGCRGAPRPRPRPSRARTSARTRGSSSRG